MKAHVAGAGRTRVRAQLSPVIHLYVDGEPAQLAALEELMEKLEACKMMVMRGCPGATQATQACDVAKMHWEDVLEECRGQDERAHQAVERPGVMERKRLGNHLYMWNQR